MEMYMQLRKRRQRNKAAKIWYGECSLYISQDDLTSNKVEKIDYENTFSMQNPNNVRGDTKSFNNKTMDFLHKLTQKAQVPKGNKIEFYAAGEERIGANNLYAMVLCTQTFGDCEACLKSAIKELSKCCSGKQGARVYMGTSCNLRYELYPFLSK
ncbi:unnamed protein product [Arabis nemorensis]|uniref:Gnk2-homologous domain-containing protein n=1 Tax=Arabis nemorensis TaxID=586526 RepID=A0A565CSM3_9BRAS|nr:unnamed protein product [Arabis nemorensis]